MAKRKASGNTARRGAARKGAPGRGATASAAGGGAKRKAAARGAAATRRAKGSGSAPARGAGSRTRARGGARGGAAGRVDAITLLKNDHREVRELIDQFEDARAPRKRALAERICRLLTVHARIEEEIFYPAAREALREEDLVDEAEVEHASAKELIAQIEGAPEDEKFEAKVKVLGEYVKHHVQEEESEMFRQVRATGLDLAALGERLQARKLELLGGDGPVASAAARMMGADAEDEDETSAARMNGARGGSSQPQLGARAAGRRGGRPG